VNATPHRHDQIQMLIDEIRRRGSLLDTKVVTAGFDGFIDTISKVIRKRESLTNTEIFRSVAEFGKYITGKNGSLSLELEEKGVKIGGNMPILANAFGSLRVNVNCIGALGYPNKHTAFDSLPKTCTKYSYAEPGTSIALEFDDGKIMIGNMGELNSITWGDIKNRVGLSWLTKLYQSSDLICLVNWSELESSPDVWSGFYDDIVAKSPTRDRKFFFDLSDCSKRNDEAIRGILDLLNDFATFGTVTLGVNKNEATRLHQVLSSRPASDLIELVTDIYEQLRIDSIVLHSSAEAVGINKKGTTVEKSFFAPNPKLSTGAGDNFNAGYNAGVLMEFESSQKLLLGHAVSGFYVRNGQSPSLSNTLAFLQNELEHQQSI
jgi:hypothetical protein